MFHGLAASNPAAAIRRKLREAEYGPLTDPDFLKTISSIHRLDEIKAPMLIAHGLNDPRVPVGEAMQLAVGLQKRGYDPELLFFPDEGHGFAKLENRLLFAKRMVKFQADLTSQPAEADVPWILETLADALLAADTRSGNFSQHVADSLKGRAIILRAAGATRRIPETGGGR